MGWDYNIKCIYVIIPNWPFWHFEMSLPKETLEDEGYLYQILKIDQNHGVLCYSKYWNLIFYGETISCIFLIRAEAQSVRGWPASQGYDPWIFLWVRSRWVLGRDWCLHSSRRGCNKTTALCPCICKVITRHNIHIQWRQLNSLARTLIINQLQKTNRTLPLLYYHSRNVNKVKSEILEF